MKPIMFIIFLFNYVILFSQDQVDITTPIDSPFDAGNSIEGLLLNSINEVTGKVIYSLPVATISAGEINYGVGISYNSQTAFEMAKKTNEFVPTSVLGVGWSMPTPKIIVDHKQTGTREDDAFYLNDGASVTKLHCINKGATIWEFQAENFNLWKIDFHFSNTENDYWIITKEDGIEYTYGDPNIGPNTATGHKAREYTLRYGNWIGDSKRNGTMHTIVWNLYKIKDRWDNDITFEYDRVDQTLFGDYQTEASYLKKISTSRGGNVKFTYLPKISDEYYEPHQEVPEPDAYHERYEKKYLSQIQTYNNFNELINTYNLSYSIYGTSLNTKRYLMSMTQKNSNNDNLPAQQFEYNTSGTYMGGLKKVIYPSGGSATYNYTNKLLFNNSSNRYISPLSIPTGYKYYSALVRDNYSLFVVRTIDPVSGDKYRFKIFRTTWDGKNWDTNEYTFPHLLNDGQYESEKMQDFYSILEEDFYGFAYDNGTNAYIYLFHLETDGYSWNSFQHTNLNHGEGDPSFLSGEGFAALGSHYSGRIYTYFWNGVNWNFKLISQGLGQYYYGANNNFILSLNENGGADMITGVNHEDNYYLHYLDAEKKWQTKSWSSAADPYILGIELPSYFYSSNSMTGFVADDNPELFMRWDTDYNLNYIDDVLGRYNDQNPIQTSSSGMFALQSWYYKRLIKSARFNGYNWDVSTIPTSGEYYAKPSYGTDYVTFQNNSNYNNGIGYQLYDPNYELWSLGTITSINSNQSIYKMSGVANNFLIAGGRAYKKSNKGTATPLFSEIANLSNDTSLTHSDGLYHIFLQANVQNSNQVSSHLYFINKETGSLNSFALDNKGPMGGSIKIGGYTPFLSPSVMWLTEYYGVQIVNNQTVTPYLYRIIDDKINSNIYDPVVYKIEIDDNHSPNKRSIRYTYNQPNSLPDNTNTFYGEVTIENKGHGFGESIGKITKIFDNGSTDIQMAGILLEERVFDNNNTLQKTSVNLPTKYIKTAHNGSTTIAHSYYVRTTGQRDTLYLNNKTISNSSTYNYFPSGFFNAGMLSSSYTQNSEGYTEKVEIRYANTEYSFLANKNIQIYPHETTRKVNNEVISIEKTQWINSSNKIYPWITEVGPTSNDLRIISKVTDVDNVGNIIGTNNGQNLYSCTLFGYKNTFRVAQIGNASYNDVINNLDVTYEQLQTLNANQLESELLKLYERLPNAMIAVSIYDNDGKVIKKIDGRKETMNFHYDSFDRLEFTTDSNNNVLEKRVYNFGK